MKLVTVATMREAERRAMDEFGISEHTLMDRAARGAAEKIAFLAMVLEQPHAEVLLLAGKGNNGGDAFATAIWLKNAGLRPTVWLAGAGAHLRGAAAQAFEQMKHNGIPWEEKNSIHDWEAATHDSWNPPILVDGLLGIGTKGEPEGLIRRAINFLRLRVNRSLVVSLDIPSGLDPDTGTPSSATVLADMTLTMGFPKVGLVAEPALEYTGRLLWVDIGLPFEIMIQAPFARSDLEFISGEDIRPLLPRRVRVSNKGTWGKILLIGGSGMYPGAITLAAAAAAHSGAGMLHVLTVSKAAATIILHCPEAIMHAVEADSLTEEALQSLPDGLKGWDAILIGPGLGRTDAARALVLRVLKETSCPVVVDADAISVLAGHPEALATCPHPVVITPHPGEMATLLGKETDHIQRHRMAAVQHAIERGGCTVILKGAGTLVAQGTRPIHVNVSGNPGMASAGTGDVLAGLLTSLIGQRLTPFNAARAAVWLHGHAGDIASMRMTEIAMNARDVIHALPYAFRLLSVR